MLDDASPPVAFHSKHSDGIQFHLKGNPVTYHLIHPNGAYEKIVLGPNIENGEHLQLVVAGGTRQSMPFTFIPIIRARVLAERLWMPLLSIRAFKKPKTFLSTCGMKINGLSIFT
jgi:hypothetical protein